MIRSRFLLLTSLLCISPILANSGTPQVGSVTEFVGNDQSFNMLLNQYPLVIVDWFATWCGPCKMFVPAYQALAKEFAPQQVIFLKIDVDKNRSLAQRYNVRSMPTFMIFKNGGYVDSLVGADKTGLRNKISRWVQ